MLMNIITYEPIGVIQTPFKVARGTPIQPEAGRHIEGTVEVFPEYIDGLKDLEGFSHIILIYHFHLSGEHNLHIKPFMDDEVRGVFATRAPSRPNPIGISVVRLKGIDGGTLHIEDIDVIDGTPLLDIKPYVPEFDEGEEIRIGWLNRRVGKLPQTRDDGRFAGE